MKKNKNRVNMKTKNKKTTKEKKIKIRQIQYKYYKQIIPTGKKVMITINTKTTHYKLNMLTYIYTMLTTSSIAKLICI